MLGQQRARVRRRPEVTLQPSSYALPAVGLALTKQSFQAESLTHGERSLTVQKMHNLCLARLRGSGPAEGFWPGHLQVGEGCVMPTGSGRSLLLRSYWSSFVGRRMSGERLFGLARAEGLF